jgi:hypothetical protein
MEVYNMGKELLGISEEDDALDNLELDAEDTDLTDVDEDIDEDAEDVDDEVEDNEEEDVEEDSDNEEESDEPTEEPDQPQTLFDKNQQAEVNRLIKARLDRQDTKLVRDLSKAAGVEIAHNELTPAARLWGLLKANPELSKSVDGLISEALAKGEAKAPDKADNSVDAVTQRLELKEAILDLKASDSTFSKNAEKILTWAENEGYEIVNGKSLKMAYLAWKGSQGKIAEAIQKSTAKRKQETKKMMQQRATVQSTKAGKSTGKTDYRRMSDSAVLASEGIKLFTDD